MIKMKCPICGDYRTYDSKGRIRQTCGKDKCHRELINLNRVNNPRNWIYISSKGKSYKLGSSVFDKAWKLQDKAPGYWISYSHYKSWETKHSNKSNYDENGKFIPSVNAAVTSRLNPSNFDKLGRYLPAVKANINRKQNKDNFKFVRGSDTFYPGSIEFEDAWSKYINLSKGTIEGLIDITQEKRWNTIRSNPNNYTTDGRLKAAVKAFKSMVENGNQLHSKQEDRIINWIKNSGFICGHSKKSFPYYDASTSEVHDYYPDIFVVFKSDNGDKEVVYIEAKSKAVYDVNPNQVESKMISMKFYHNKKIIILDECINVNYQEKFSKDLYLRLWAKQRKRIERGLSSLKAYWEENY